MFFASFSQLSRTWLTVCLTAVFALMPSQLKADNAVAFPEVYEQAVPQAFALATPSMSALIFVDADDYKVVHIAAQMLADDVERVGCPTTAVRHAKSLKEAKGKAVVIVGTVGHSQIIDELISKHRIDVSGISGKWESCVVTTLDRPAKGIGQALIIAGSDRRGTAFGVMSLCQAIGVSPWYFWADVAPAHKQSLYVAPGTFQQGEPSVKYRGIFINDERFGGWARWAELTYDKEHGVVGPKTYERVFELLLRLKGNYLWPAMHPGTQAFNADPENARLADDYAITMGTSHCEQMLRNNEGEWKAVDEQAKREGRTPPLGDFNYLTNRQTMLNYWEERVRTNGRYENTYTIGLRGIHDYPMEGAASNEERIAIMQQAINDQRAMLARNINCDITDIPQVLCTYEEVLDAYHGGLQVPDDVTMLWSDDKQGFMRNLSNPQEQLRKGGAGIYYHLSYHGDPDSWFWLSPLAPGLVSSELTKAYEYGARNIWVFNVGDIKPAEKELSLAMELAWNVDSWRPTEAYSFTEQWIEKTFFPSGHAPNPSELSISLAKVQDEYYRLMAYGKEFHTRWLEYSDAEIDARLRAWKHLEQEVEALKERVPEQLQTAYYELFSYPIQGAAAMNRYVLLARRSRVLASQRVPRALEVAAEALAARDKVDSLTRYYNEQLANGKWGHFFNWHPNWYLDGRREVMEVADDALLAKAEAMPTATWILQETPDNRPTTATKFEFEADADGMMPLWIKARTRINNNDFAPQNNEFATVSVVPTTNDGPDAYFRASALPHGNVWHTDTIGPMWSCVGEIPVQKGRNRIVLTDIVPGTQISAIFVGVQPQFVPEPLHRIGAKQYVGKHDADGSALTMIPQLGYNDGVTALPYTTPSYEPTAEAPWLEYDLPAIAQDALLEVRMLPTLRIYEGRDARFAVSIDGAAPAVFSIHEGDYTSEWRWNVLRGYARRFVQLPAGAHKVRIYLLDPAITLEELVVRK